MSTVLRLACPRKIVENPSHFEVLTRHLHRLEDLWFLEASIISFPAPKDLFSTHAQHQSMFYMDYPFYLDFVSSNLYPTNQSFSELHRYQIGCLIYVQSRLSQAPEFFRLS